MKATPRMGPRTLAIPKTAPKRPNNAGRLCKGTTGINMLKAPCSIPALPSPAIARPTIRLMELGAAPQIAEPTSKIPMKVIKVHFTSYKVYNLPIERQKAAAVSRYANPYQPTSLREPKSFVIVGIAIPMISLSRATRKTER